MDITLNRGMIHTGKLRQSYFLMKKYLEKVILD